MVPTSSQPGKKAPFETDLVVPNLVFVEPPFWEVILHEIMDIRVPSWSVKDEYVSIHPHI
jgi:hypothetical protein